MAKPGLVLLQILSVFCLASCENNDLQRLSDTLPATTCASAYVYGYTDRVSYFPGETVTVFIQASNDLPLCRLDIYNINGEWALSAASPLSIQSISEKNPSVNGFGLSATVRIRLPGNLKSGVYLIEHKTPFVVKSPRPVDVMVVYPSNTANAYCESGGKGLYTVVDKPSAVSFLRPIPVPATAEAGLKWFSTLSDLNVGFIADIDLNNYYEIGHTKILVIAGHSEYWARKGRENFDRFVDEGGHALILSGNTMWWQIRYSAEQDKLIRFLGNDPEPNPLLKTENWCNHSLRYSIINSIGADFNHGGYGLKTDRGWDGYKISNPDSPLLQGTGLKRGDILSLPSGEYDGAPISGFDTDQYPILDMDSLHFSHIELIGFDRGYRFDKETIGTFIVFKRNEASGIIVHGGSYDWCSAKGIGGKDGDKIRMITRNAIDKLLTGKPVFSW